MLCYVMLNGLNNSGFWILDKRRPPLPQNWGSHPTQNTKRAAPYQYRPHGRSSHPIVIPLIQNRLSCVISDLWLYWNITGTKWVRKNGRAVMNVSINLPETYYSEISSRECIITAACVDRITWESRYSWTRCWSWRKVWIHYGTRQQWNWQWIWRTGNVTPMTGKLLQWTAAVHLELAAPNVALMHYKHCHIYYDIRTQRICTLYVVYSELWDLIIM